MPQAGTKDTTQSTTVTGGAGAPRDLSPDSPARTGSSPTGTTPPPVDLEHTYSGDASTSTRWDGGHQGSMGSQARDLKHRSAEQARETYEDVRRFTNEALEKARREFGERGQQAKSRLQGMAGDQKNRVAGTIDDLCKAAQAAVDRLEEQNDPKIAGYARTAADSLGGVRDYLQHAEISDIMDDASRFTRRHPGLVLGGLFIAGLAASRFMKADRPYQARGRLPHGADESLYEDVYESQHESLQASGMRDYDSDFDDDFPNVSVTADHPTAATGNTGGVGAGWSAGTPGSTGVTGPGRPAHTFGSTDTPETLDNPEGHTGMASPPSGTKPLSGEGADTLKGGA